MNKKLSLILTGCLTAALLQGCVGAIVAGGAAGASAATDRRTMGTIVEDQSIEIKAKRAINADGELADQARISTTSFNGVLLLTGQAPNEDARARAADKVKDIDKVRKVHNEIVIGQPISLQTASRDTWITTKVKSMLLGAKGISANDIKVVTDNGAVYLMGLVTHAEADIASDIASRTDGVERVVRIFEYID
ncbi:MAG: division/outer membrane stress-associated lipid-binding lipoprotein [Pseudomonadota bacterium]